MEMHFLCYRQILKTTLYILKIFNQVLNDIVLQTGGTYQKEHQHQNVCEITYADLPDGIRGFYFSANWVSLLQKKKSNFQIIYMAMSI